MNWLTIVFLLILFWSIYRGWQRRFAPEVGYLTAQLTHLLAGVLALGSAWLIGTRISHWIDKVQPSTLPNWLQQAYGAWQQSPQIAHLVVLFLCYLVISSLLHALVRPIPVWIANHIPRKWGQLRGMGAVVGIVVGASRILVLGAFVFLALDVTTIPALRQAATASAPYQVMESKVYNPWLRPFVSRELPVLSQGALEPLSKDISLFAVPTGQPGTQAGVLVVPPEIASLAKKITVNDKTDDAKAHALYEWEIHHISYDWKKYNDYVYKHQWDQQSPLDTLRTGKGVCADYALLYADLAHAVGLKVEIDEGIGGTALQHGSHAWNHVYDRQRGVWIPVDTTWGAEQDVWYNPANFDDTHQLQTKIVIQGGQP